MAAKLDAAGKALLAANAASAAETVKVVVRCRPLNSKETKEKRANVVGIDKELGQISIKPSADAPADGRAASTKKGGGGVGDGGRWMGPDEHSQAAVRRTELFETTDLGGF